MRQAYSGSVVRQKIMLLPFVLILMISGFTNSIMADPAKPVDTVLSESVFQQYLEAYRARRGSEQAFFPQGESENRFLNSLILSSSPYLIKHATNPINWQAWSESSLQEAKNNNRLIFLSIGFLSCYWCQVMEKESFRDEQVASVLNQHFISLKVDREFSPDIDQLMITALQKVKGSSGWPVTAVLTPDADLVFIDSYLSKEELVKVLTSLSERWAKNPQPLINQGKLFDRLLKVDEPRAAGGNVAFDGVAYQNQLLAHLDRQNGGISGAPKFPDVGLLLYLIDMLQRDFDPEIASVVQLQLSNMVSKGLYDPIYGGFHRYVSDESWLVPHYEKMLYTQALMIEAYSKAFRLFTDPLYEKVVRETLVFLNDFLLSDINTYYSALDAVYEDDEGGFYLYSQEEIARLGDMIKPDGAIRLYQKGERFGLHVSRPLPEQMNSIRSSLSGYRNKQNLNVDTKILTSWNALLISALKEAYLAFGDKIYQNTALQVGISLLDTQVTTNSLFRVRFQGKSAQAATLEDYAYLIRAFIDLYDIAEDRSWLVRASRLTEEAVERLYHPEKGFLYSALLGTTGSVVTWKDGELLNPLAVMVENIERIDGRTREDYFKDIMTSSRQKLNSVLNQTPLEQFFGAYVLTNQVESRLDPVQYIAGGNGRVYVKEQPDRTFIINIKMQSGWHVNSDAPLSKELIPTSVTFPANNEFQVFFPLAVTKKFGPSQTDISVFTEQFTINLSGGKGVVELSVQACNSDENVCLLPETLSFFLGRSS